MRNFIAFFILGSFAPCFSQSNMIEIVTRTSTGVPVVQLGDLDIGAFSPSHGSLELFDANGNMGADIGSSSGTGQLELYRNGKLGISMRGGQGNQESFMEITGTSVSQSGFPGGVEDMIQLTNDFNTTTSADDVSFFIGIQDSGSEGNRLTFDVSGGSTSISRITDTGVYQQVSDIRLKENIYELRTVLPSLMNVKTANYNFKTSPNRSEIGFLAQDLRDYFPEVVEGNDNIEGDYLMVNYQGMVPVLTKAIQEQQDIILEQKTTLDSVNYEISNLKSNIEVLLKRIAILETK